MNSESVHRSIHSLSPCDKALLASHQQISSLIPVGGTRKKRLPVLSPNNAAVVLWIEVGGVCILLGADLEEVGDRNSGWQVIVGSQGRPQSKASFFKIPHHGSITADSPDVWSSMLAENPYATTTPFIRQRIPLPTSHDVDRLCDRTSNGYLTAGVKQAGKIKRPSTVQKQIDQTTRRLETIDNSGGQVRFRCPLEKVKSPQWSVEVFGGALPLSQVYVNRSK